MVAAELQKNVAADLRTISLDRMEAALAAAGVKPPSIDVDNTPPAVLVSNSPAILVPIDGVPVMKPVPGYANYQRVVNTKALIVQGGFDSAYYLHVYDGWMTASSLAGPWTPSTMGPFRKAEFDKVAKDLSAKGIVDLLDGGAKASPKPSLANGAPAIFTSQGPAELIVFDGQPDFVPIVGTQLLWASNTHSDVLIDTTTSSYYVLLAGRWFRSQGLSGPWSFVAANALPADFARIPPTSLAAAVLPSVAGTAQAQEALIANSRAADGDRADQGRPGVHAQLRRSAEVPADRRHAAAVRRQHPHADHPRGCEQLLRGQRRRLVLRHLDHRAVGDRDGGAGDPLHDPGELADPLRHLRPHLRVDAPVRLHGYTPGYLGTVVSPYGTVVYGTGYAYTAWIGDAWYPAPVTYIVAAVPIYNPWVGFTFGFAVGLATTPWTYPYYGGAWYYPAYWGGYPCCGTASANVYGQWGNTVYSGTRSWYAGGGVAGTTASGTYNNQRTGASGSYNAGRQFNAYTGNATRGYDRTIDGAAGGSGQVARAGNYNVYTGQRSTANAASGTTAGGSTYNRAGASTAGPEGNAHVGGGSTYNAKTGQTNTWGTASVGNNHYADVNGNVYKNTGDGWQKADGGGGWSNDASASSWADRESQARSGGESRASGFSYNESQRFGSTAGWLAAAATASAAAAAGAGASAAAAVLAGAVSAAAGAKSPSVRRTDARRGRVDAQG